MQNNPDKLRIMIVDDHQLIVDGLISLLSEQEGVESVLGFTNGKQAIEQLEKKPVDVVLADVNMPEISGIELTSIITSRFPGVKVIALSMHDDSAMISRMIGAGASGYVLKSTHISELMEAIETVATNAKFLSREVQSIIMQNIYTYNDPINTIEPRVVSLTPRESEILNLIAKEFTNEEIAERLFISERTVETHRKNIFVKTQTKTIVGLMRYAMEHNLIVREK